MAELVEIVFEGVSELQIQSICEHLGGSVYLTALRDAAAETGVGEVRFHPLILSGDRLLPNAHFRLVAYEGGPFDVEINFDIDEVRDADESFQIALHEFARDIAEACGVDSYFCGYEPAIDEDTRLFTGDTMGPVRLR